MTCGLTSIWCGACFTHRHTLYSKWPVAWPLYDMVLASHTHTHMIFYFKEHLHCRMIVVLLLFFMIFISGVSAISMPLASLQEFYKNSLKWNVFLLLTGWVQLLRTKCTFQKGYFFTQELCMTLWMNYIVFPASRWALLWPFCVCGTVKNLIYLVGVCVHVETRKL